MSILNPLGFQKEAVDKLVVSFLKLWRQPDRKLPIVFKSPTGSGKTFMMASFINELNNLPQWDEDKAFIWITFSDDLAMQSKEKFEKYFENTLKNELLTVDDFNRGKLFKNNILFINWQKLVSRAAENRVLRRPDDENQHKETGFYFEDIVERTHADGRNIILVIDESHKHKTTELAQNIIDIINPKIIIDVSATPDDIPNAMDVELGIAGFVHVKRDDVVDEGLIKDNITVQTEEQLKAHGGQDLDKVLLDIGFAQRMDLKGQFEKLGKKVNPLMLIQLPNDDKALHERGEQTKEEIVLEYLRSKGVDVETKVALWFDNHKKNLEFIEENDDTTDYLLFKQAAGTGWDCPRAHILVMFREITSTTFYVQTLGRILRMAAPHNKADFIKTPDLRTGFLYTNYRRDEIKDFEAVTGNKLPTQFASLRKLLHDEAQFFELESAYIQRVDYGDLANSAKFQMSFLKSMNEYFDIVDGDILEKLKKKLQAKDLELNPKLNNQLIVDAQFEDFDRIRYEFAKKGHDYNFDMSYNDVERTFNYLCYKVLTEQTDEDAKITNVSRSWNRLKSALRIWFKNVLGTESIYYYKVFVYDLVEQGTSSVFRPAITKALKDYRPILKKLLKEKKQKAEKAQAPVFRIKDGKDEYTYTDDFEEVKQNRCILDKCFIRKDYDGKQNEKDFINFIDKHKKTHWWFKNGDQGKDYYAVKYFNTTEQKESLFYPDWIIKFTDGRIGIFDTKAGRTLLTEGRAKGLALKLNELGKNYVGGIVKQANGVFEFCDSVDYDDQTPKNNKWKPLSSVF
jgi:type III restriction enzyme